MTVFSTVTVAVTSVLCCSVKYIHLAPDPDSKECSGSFYLAPFLTIFMYYLQIVALYILQPLPQQLRAR